ncbi:MAG: hypothetical protein U0183_20470 [Polyangiaceae bacterium]
MRTRLLAFAPLLAVSWLVSACSSDAEEPPVTPTSPSATATTPTPTATSTPTTGPTGSTPPADAGPATGGDAETPATGDAATVKAWLESKAYTKWACEPAPHPGRAGTGHSANRICSNGLLSRHGAGEYPVGAASVKELFDGNGTLTGYAMLLKTKPGGVESFYWYENIGASVIANGQGDSGSAKSVCTGCHDGAGKNGQTGHDGVFTQVK